MDTTYYDVIQGSDEWFRLRLGIITASNIDKVIAGHKSASKSKDGAMAQTYAAYAYQLAYERISQMIGGKFHNANFDRGNESEPKALEDYRLRTGVKAVRAGIFIRQTDWGTIGASPDFLLPDGGIGEIKAKNGALHIAAICEDAIPNTHIEQIQAQIMLANAPYADFVCFTEGLPLLIMRAKPDAALHAKIEEACIFFEGFIVSIVEKYYSRTQGISAPTTGESKSCTQ